VIRFATALLAYRLAEIDFWFARHGGTTDEGNDGSGGLSHASLGLGHVLEPDFSTDRRDLVRLARRALETAFSIRKPDTEGEMTERSYQTRKALAAVIEAARGAQPGAIVGADTKELLTKA